MEHLKTLHKEFPDQWNTTKLQNYFGISHSAVKRILRSKFEPSQEVIARQDNKATRQRLEMRKRLTNKYKVPLKYTSKDAI